MVATLVAVSFGRDLAVSPRTRDVDVCCSNPERDWCLDAAGRNQLLAQLPRGQSLVSAYELVEAEFGGAGFGTSCYPHRPKSITLFWTECGV